MKRVSHRQGAASVVPTLVVVLLALVAPTAEAQTFTVLHTFTGGTDGVWPQGGLVQDTAGNLYGTTFLGGNGFGCNRPPQNIGCGVVFKVNTSGTETVVHRFVGRDGSMPAAGLLIDPNGNIYGTTDFGGTSGRGAVFKLGTASYSFKGQPDGSQPFGSLVQDASGNLYGTTAGGGSSNNGTVFKVDAANNETVLYSFTGGADGSQPFATLIRDAGGNLYGTTAAGGAFGSGTVFKLDMKNNETVLHSFNGADGANPEAGVIRDAAGNFYGTTSRGGAFDKGTVFKLDTSGQETVVHSFTGGADGGNPGASLLLDALGNLYGTTSAGGDLTCGTSTGCGTVFKIDTLGNETVLHSFNGHADGSSPTAGVIMDAAGSLYGTALLGGDFSCRLEGCGTVFILGAVGFDVSVALMGTGSGTVTSTPPGINCGATCSASFAGGTMLTLTATAVAGSAFSGWTGACAGTGSCTLTVNAAKSVSATFNASDFSLAPASANLTVQFGGRGSDIITITPESGSFGSAIQLTCAVAGPSPMPGCVMSPTSVTPGTNSATSTLTIDATGLAMLMPSMSRPLGPFYVAMWFPLALVSLVPVAGRKQRHRCWASCGFLLLSLLMLFDIACGGSSSRQPTSYVVSVTGSANGGMIQHTTQVTVTVH
jgi:uncharacterized repeat protein (TIGR03803 family)